jgi:probable phosphoglycerate mutase
MRHGKTDWNARHKIQGRTDIPLNEDGRLMAEKAGEEYREVHFDVCYCSPLVRARETAEHVLRGRGIPIISDERLAEMSFGVCEGMENSFRDPDSPLHVLFQKPEKYVNPPEGAESLEELYVRTGEFLREVAEPLLSQGKDVLIVGHGAMNSSIVCQVKNLPVEQFWSVNIDHCKLLRLV